ncbi:MAG TPA: DUF934 domain-containing protein [Steroidobacteraceae bacterium]|jgi:uncharacterized protein (DUF934 family)
MRHILRRHEYVADDWRYFPQEGGGAGGAAASDSDALIVPLADFKADRASWLSRTGPLGVRIAPADKAEDLADDLPRLSLIAVTFPSFSDGRGFSQAEILRTRLGFKGRLRAVGAVKQDLIFYMARCGIDEFELAAGEDVEEASRALQRFTVAYQPGDPAVKLTRQRFFA